MRKWIVLGTVALAAVIAGQYATGSHTPVTHQGSPAFQALLDDAIARLEGAAEQVTAISVTDARADAMQTMGIYTCVDFRTCDAIATCDGSHTCDGEETCWASTCADVPTCECGCEQYTLEGGFTCDGTATCHEDCPGWPTYLPTWPTCEGGHTCVFTCPPFVSCSGGGASGVESTTWGQVKTDFSQ